ncbi:SusC/RagA family TonB-linked outer membrane protein [Saccharicrinis aurantiacus]|uniref:SusC/RagA family TonB-linked outer membrane protein n=1 Tax=Saccharicrinis aurantiacus TaxID=1849719 RepID=UPI001C9E4E4E|nr:TonB-dependent receptor [Saccharicrinis aurantiacus]
MKKLSRMLSLSNRWVILLILSLTSIGVFAQQSFITGTVTSAEDGLPIPGVSVVVKGTTTGTITNMDGKYNIKVWQGKELLFSFIGMKNATVVAEGGIINVKMEPESIGLEEVVAIGYGTQKKKELTGAVVQVKSDEITKIATADLGDALQGKVAGVSVQSSSGAPGEAANIQIRGVATSFEGANNNPLYIVDGIPYDGDPGLSPNEIETIDVLKDAASAAAYGTRGAAGVILITTKQGEAGDIKVSYNGYYGIQKITSGMPLVDFEDHMYIETLNQVNNDATKHENNFWFNLEQSPHLMSNNNNIMDVVQEDNAAIQNHSIQLSGGKKNLRASAILNYFSQDGTLINSGYERMNGRANINFSKKKLKVRAGFGFSIDEKKNAPWGILYDAYKFKPYSEMIDPNNMSLTSEGSDNDLTNASTLAIKFAQTDITEGKAFNANTNVSYEIIKGLNVTYTFGANYKNTFRNQVVPLFQLTDWEGNLRAQTTRSSIKNTSGASSKITSEAGANYTKKFGKHKFKLLGVYTYEKSDYNQHLGTKYDLHNNSVTVLNGGSKEPNAESGDTNWTQDRTTTLIGMLGRLNYDYKGKYLFTASVRRDGSSKFGEDERWGVFPAFSAGWNISDEVFWSGIKDVVNTLKLRGSWGKVGNNNFGDYLYNNVISTGKDYVFGPAEGEALFLGAAQTSYANPYVMWETSVSSNLGVDVYLLNNKVNFTAEVYSTEKQDMLFPFQVPASSGAGTGGDSTVPMNIGDMTNKGVEFSGGYRHSGKFKWGINATFSKNLNEVSMPGDLEISYYTDGKPVADGQNNYVVTAIADGYEAGSFFMMPTNGIVNTEAKLAEFQKIVPSAQMGDLIYVDTNGDGEISDADRTYAGSGMPDFEAGLNFDIAYKGFDFNMQWYASVGNEIINGSKLYASFNKMHPDMLHQWTPDNPYSQRPIFRGRDHINSASFADIWVEDGSFLRLRNVILGYTIPKKLTRKAKISKCRVYIAAQNPLTITEYDGYDPEIGSNGLSKRGLDVGNYPVAAQYRAGIQLDF